MHRSHLQRVTNHEYHHLPVENQINYSELNLELPVVQIFPSFLTEKVVYLLP